MTKKPIRLVVFIISLFFTQNLLFAQMAGVNGIFAVPKSEFSTNIKNYGYGVGVEGLFFAGGGKIPFGIGINLGFINYGNEDYKAPLSTTLPGITVNLSHTNNIANLHLFFRLTTGAGDVRPYVDLLFGANYLYTESKVTSEKDNSEFASSKNISDYAWSYGVGGGFLIKIYTPRDSDNSQLAKLFLDLKVRYLRGTEAEYLTEGSIIGHPNGTVTLLTSKSKTDLMQVQVGVTALFNSLNFQ